MAIARPNRPFRHRRRFGIQGASAAAPAASGVVAGHAAAACARPCPRDLRRLSRGRTGGRGARDRRAAVAHRAARRPGTTTSTTCSRNSRRKANRHRPNRRTYPRSTTSSCAMASCASTTGRSAACNRSPSCTWRCRSCRTCRPRSRSRSGRGSRSRSTALPSTAADREATPFAQTNAGTMKLALSELDVTPYLGYLPASLPLRLTRGRLSVDLGLQFELPKNGSGSIVLIGNVGARDVALTDRGGAPPGLADDLQFASTASSAGDKAAARRAAHRRRAIATGARRRGRLNLQSLMASPAPRRVPPSHGICRSAGGRHRECSECSSAASAPSAKRMQRCRERRECECRQRGQRHAGGRGHRADGRSASRRSTSPMRASPGTTPRSKPTSRAADRGAEPEPEEHCCNGRSRSRCR